MLRSFQELNVVNGAECTPPPPIDPFGEPGLVQAFPNPAVSTTMLEFKILQPGHVLMQLVNPQGRVLRTIYENQREPAGTIKKPLDVSGLKLGTYYIRFQNGSTTQMKPLLKVN
jgi:hypothetical protein